MHLYADGFRFDSENNEGGSDASLPFIHTVCSANLTNLAALIT